MFFQKKESITIPQKGFLQAAGVAGYCFLVGLIIRNGEVIFGEMEGITGPAALLTLLSVSVLICGLLVFYNPYQLFFSNKKKEAADLVLLTTGWLAAFFVAFLILNIIIR